MKQQTTQTLLEQMHLSEFEVEHRKSLFGFTAEHARLLKSCSALVKGGLDKLVEEFYEAQTNEPEIALLIGDADTLRRLRDAQRHYVMDLFSGVYDLEYINSRLRIGLVHKRIGVEPKLYLSAVYLLKSLLDRLLTQIYPDMEECDRVKAAVEKLMYFDVTLVFDTYIRSMVSEIETAKKKSEQYAWTMEEKVKERTLQLEELSQTDPLTGLHNSRYLADTLTRILRSARRRAEPVSLVYIDINDFKAINDRQGHQRGDEVLRTLADALRAVSRQDDNCFRCGGDEFCVILPNSRKEDARDNYVVRLQELFTQTCHPVSLSVGVVQTGPEHYADADALIGEADEHMYEEKRKYKASNNPSAP